MKPKIAVATVRGKAYYLIVNELKQRKILFLSLTPDEPIPVDVKVVVTTKKERPKITHLNVLEYEEEKNPADVVDEAVRMIKGKKMYDGLVVGVDPGQNFGVAVLGDGSILETKNCLNVIETVNVIKDVLRRTPAANINIRVGSGAPSYAEELLRNLVNVVPESVVIESVREEGTSRNANVNSHRRGRRDVSAAIRIAQRQGKTIPRRKRQC